MAKRARVGGGKGGESIGAGTSGEEAAAAAAARLTRGIGELVLLPLDTVLQAFCFAARLLDARLHCLGRDVVRSLRVHRWRRLAAKGGRGERRGGHSRDSN